MNERIEHADRDALTRAVADGIAGILRDAVARKGEARIALSGGSTPGPVYERLSADESVPWSRTVVTLADERLTPEGHADSNETLVRRTLLKGAGAAARFEPLREGQESLPPQDVILLGMGSDGHVASLFPGARELGAALAPSAPAVLRVVPDPLPAHAPYHRLTLTLPTILEADHLVLAITGEEKRSVLERASGDGPVDELPVRALLRAGHSHLTIHWAA